MTLGKHNGCLVRHPRKFDPPTRGQFDSFNLELPPQAPRSLRFVLVPRLVAPWTNSAAQHPLGTWGGGVHRPSEVWHQKRKTQTQKHTQVPKDFIEPPQHKLEVEPIS